MTNQSPSASNRKSKNEATRIAQKGTIKNNHLGTTVDGGDSKRPTMEKVEISMTTLTTLITKSDAH